MEKSYERINWENEPSILTPLNAVNLNKMDYSMNEIDDRVIFLDSSKAEQSDLLLSVKGITYNKNTGIFVFTWQNGSTMEVDLNIEKIPVLFSMSETGIITMTTTDGTSYTCDVSSLIKAYLFDDSDQIDFSVTTEEDGSYHVTGIIKGGSITEEMLESGMLGRINSAKGYAEEALNKATEAATSAVMAESYAKGGTGIREGEDADNAKYYAEKAKETDIGVLSDEVNKIKGDLSNSADWLNGGNIFDESKEIILKKMISNDGVFENTDADDRTYFFFQLQLMYNNSVIYSNDSVTISKNGIYSFTIDTTNYEFDSLRIKHNGKTIDLSIKFQFNKKGIYTVSIEVLSAKPDVIGGLKFKNITINEGNKALPYAQYSKSNVELTEEVRELQSEIETLKTAIVALGGSV